MVCVGIHNHSAPVPERTSITIKSNLQSLIEQAIHEDSIITSRSLLSDNKYYYHYQLIMLLILVLILLIRDPPKNQ